MAIIKSKIKLTIPEGLTQKGDITVDDAKNIAKVTVTGRTVGSQEVSVQYNGGEIKKTTITVTPTPAFDGEPSASPTAIEVGADTTVTATFNVEGVQASQVQVTPSDGLTLKGTAKVEGTTFTVTYVGKTAGDQTVKLELNGASKTANVTVNAAATLKSVTASPSSVVQGQDSVITMQF